MTLKLMDIGFVGLGTMGQPMAVNLIKAGFNVHGYDLFPEKAQDFVQTGGKMLASPKDVAAASQVVVTMINDLPNLEDVLFGAAGCVRGLRDDLIFIDASTIAPNDIRKIHARLLEKGCELLDAPVSGGSKGATDGTLTIMVGGDAATFETCRPVLEAMSARLTYMGPSGAGQATKLCSQIMLGINTLGVSEALMLASREGIDLDRMIEALVVGAGESRMLRNHAGNMARNSFPGKFPIKLIQKDFKLVNQTLIEDNLSLPGASLVLQLYNSVAASEPTAGHEGLLIALEKLNGFEVGHYKA